MRHLKTALTALVALFFNIMTAVPALAAGSTPFYADGDYHRPGPYIFLLVTMAAVVAIFIIIGRLRQKWK